MAAVGRGSPGPTAAPSPPARCPETPGALFVCVCVCVQAGDPLLRLQRACVFLHGADGVAGGRGGGGAHRERREDLLDQLLAGGLRSPQQIKRLSRTIATTAGSSKTNSRRRRRRRQRGAARGARWAAGGRGVAADSRRTPPSGPGRAGCVRMHMLKGAESRGD